MNISQPWMVLLQSVVIARLLLHSVQSGSNILSSELIIKELHSVESLACSIYKNFDLSFDFSKIRNTLDQNNILDIFYFECNKNCLNYSRAFQWLNKALLLLGADVLIKAKEDKLTLLKKLELFDGTVIKTALLLY